MSERIKNAKRKFNLEMSFKKIIYLELLIFFLEFSYSNSLSIKAKKGSYFSSIKNCLYFLIGIDLRQFFKKMETLIKNTKASTILQAFIGFRQIHFILLKSEVRQLRSFLILKLSCSNRLTNRH